MKSVNLLSLCLGLCFSSVAIASMENILSSLEVKELPDNKVKVCIKQTSPFSNSAICSAATAANSQSIGKITRLYLTKKLTVKFLREGFDVEDLYSSVAIHNCKMTLPAELEVVERQGQIDELELQIDSLHSEIGLIREDVNNRQCN